MVSADYTSAVIHTLLELDADGSEPLTNAAVSFEAMSEQPGGTLEIEFAPQFAVSSALRKRITLERANDMYVVDRGKAPYVIGADARDVEGWSRETEMPADAADAEKAPSWKVVAAVHPDRETARAMARQLRAAGFAAEVTPIEGYHLVQVLRLESEAQAREVMGNLRGQPGVALPKVVPVK